MIRLELDILLVFVPLAVLPAFAANVPAEAVSSAIPIDGDRLVVPGAGRHCFLVALLTGFKRNELDLGGGSSLKMLAVGVCWKKY